MARQPSQLTAVTPRWASRLGSASGSRIGAGGSNGLKSLERSIGHQEYPRLRIGTRPADETREIGNLADFVLSPFDELERQEVRALLPRLADAAETWLRDGIHAAMNKHNAAV